LWEFSVGRGEVAVRTRAGGEVADELEGVVGGGDGVVAGGDVEVRDSIVAGGDVEVRDGVVAGGDVEAGDGVGTVAVDVGRAVKDAAGADGGGDDATAGVVAGGDDATACWMLTLCDTVAAGDPLHAAVWPVNTSVVPHPAESATVSVTA